MRPCLRGFYRTAGVSLVALAAFATHARAAQVPVVRLTASDGAQGDGFGEAVDIDGDTAIVGAEWTADACPAEPICNSGSAYVFVRSGTSW